MTAIELQLLIDGELFTDQSPHLNFVAWVTGRHITTSTLGRREWEMFPDEIDLLIIHACGYKSVDEAINNFREETRRTLKLLGGPNAWTIYKMLKAQHE